jgi:hypothetical protein
MDPSLKKEVTEYKPTGRSKGRPKKDPSELKSKPYVKTGNKRGRPSKSK